MYVIFTIGVSYQFCDIHLMELNGCQALAAGFVDSNWILQRHDIELTCLHKWLLNCEIELLVLNFESWFKETVLI